MNLTELEEYVFAYFLSGDALNVTVDGRFYRREEFVQVFEDRIFYAAQRFGSKVASNIANKLVDKLIEEKALSTTHDKLSGTSHQLDGNKYRTFIRNLIKSNCICQRSQEAGPQFWEEAFAVLTNNGRPPR
jgi:hypothetical protein